jgi:hypothetical protein
MTSALRSRGASVMIEPSPLIVLAGCVTIASQEHSHA